MLRIELYNIIKKVGNKWVVFTKNGGRRLGTHTSKQDAMKQLAAIEASKAAAAKSYNK
jgi:hypothetical protein